MTNISECIVEKKKKMVVSFIFTTLSSFQKGFYKIKYRKQSFIAQRFLFVSYRFTWAFNSTGA